MSKQHLSKQQVLAYLDGDLPSEARQAAWRHLAHCPACEALLRREQTIRQELRNSMPMVGQLRGDQLAALLPNIMAEVKQSRQMAVNRLAWGIVLVILIITLLPMVMDTPGFVMDEPLLNIPAATSTPSVQRIREDATQDAGVQNVRYMPLQNRFDVEYASPVPPPQATQAASVEPNGY